MSTSKAKVNVMHILAANISEVITDTEIWYYLPSNSKSYVGFRLAILNVNLAAGTVCWQLFWHSCSKNCIQPIISVFKFGCNRIRSGPLSRKQFNIRGCSRSTSEPNFTEVDRRSYKTLIKTITTTIHSSYGSNGIFPAVASPLCFRKSKSLSVAARCACHERAYPCGGIGEWQAKAAEGGACWLEASSGLR